MSSKISKTTTKSNGNDIDNNNNNINDNEVEKSNFLQETMLPPAVSSSPKSITSSHEFETNPLRLNRSLSFSDAVSNRSPLRRTNRHLSFSEAAEVGNSPPVESYARRAAELCTLDDVTGLSHSFSEDHTVRNNGRDKEQLVQLGEVMKRFQREQDYEYEETKNSTSKSIDTIPKNENKEVFNADIECKYKDGIICDDKSSLVEKHMKRNDLYDENKMNARSENTNVSDDSDQDINDPYGTFSL